MCLAGACDVRLGGGGGSGWDEKLEMEKNRSEA